MSAYLPDDLALSVTFFPRTSTTFAVVYGCNNAQMEEIEKRIQRAGDSTEHPLLLMGIFAELERKRLVDLADKLLDNFTLRSEHLENGIWDPSVELNATKAQENLKLCFQSRNIADHMKAVKRQLSKFLDAIDLTGKTMMGECPGDILQQKLPKREHLTNVAFQMKQRTQDIMIEYDDKINECEMVMGNTSLAMQTVSINKGPMIDTICSANIDSFGTMLRGSTHNLILGLRVLIRKSSWRQNARALR